MALFPDDLMKAYQRQRTNAALGAFAQGLLQSGARGGGLLAGLGQGAAGASQAMASGGLGDLVKLQYLSQAQEADRERKAQGAALSEVTGGYDPQSGITWDQGRPQNAGLLGNLTPQQRGLLPNLPEPMRRSVVMNQAFPDPGEGFTLNPGDVRFGPDGRPIAAAPPKPPENSATYRDWQAERRNGYKGSFLDYQKEIKAAGASNITVGGGKYGPIPAGQMLVETPEGARLVDIEGGPVAKKAEEDAAKAKTQEAARLSGEAPTANMVLNSIRDIRKEYEGANTPVFGTASIPFAQYSGSAAGKARSYIRNLQSPIALGALTRLKESSATGASGFGALNAKELQLLLDQLGVLDPDNTDPEIMMKTLDRVEGQYKRVIEDIKRNVSPERIKELGLEGLLSLGEDKMDFSKMDIGALSAVDVTSLSAAEREALDKRLTELGY